jgi:hypothetical protein
MFDVRTHTFSGLDSDPLTVNALVLVRDTTGRGINAVRVVDRENFLVRDVTGLPCVAETEVSIAGIARTRLPLHVEAAHCDVNGGPTDSFSRSPEPQLVDLVIVDEDGNLDCRTLPPETLHDRGIRPIVRPECTQAHNDIQRLRSAIRNQCNIVRVVKRTRDEYGVATGALFAAAAAAFIGAASVAGIPIFGQIMLAILLLAAVLLLVAAIGMMTLTIATHMRFLREERELHGLQRDFDVAADQLRRHCCPPHGDLTTPECEY